MAVFRYEGPWDTREVWGVSFAKGKTVEIDDVKLAVKLAALEGFVRVEDDAPEPEPVASEPDPDDYPASPEPEDFASLEIPRVGAGTIPADWETQHHSSRMKLARSLRPDLVITTADEADKVIRAEITPE